tara:strand:- start:1628 stop:1804 length:177 start_codon:yes stop_codon:yes gene_type:complete
MRVLEANYGDVRIFSDRPFGYKRYHVEWSDGTLETFSSLWYSKARVIKLVEEKLNDAI